MGDSSSTTDSDIDYVTTLVALDGVDPESLSRQQLEVLREEIFDLVNDLDEIHHEYLDVLVLDEDENRVL